MKYACKCIRKSDKLGVADQPGPVKEPHKWWKTERGYEAWCGGAETTVYTDINIAFSALPSPYSDIYYLVEDYEQ